MMKAEEMNRNLMNRAQFRHGAGLLFGAIVVVLSITSSNLYGQYPNEILNGGMEESTEEGEITGWEVFGRNNEQREEWGVRYIVDTENPFTGNSSLLVDTTEFKLKGISATQYLDAEPYAGRRVQLKAAIRGLAIPEDLEEDEVPGRAMVSISVSRTEHSGYWRTVAAEGAPRRLIRDANWNLQYIVIDVPENAEHIEISLTVNGQTKAWFDQVTLEIVPDEVELTTPSVYDEPQSFFNWWLVLPAIVLSIFCFSLFGESVFHRLAFRFTVAYWGVYFFTWWMFLLSFTEAEFIKDYMIARHGIVNWFGWNLFQKDFYPFGSGSGDTLYDYIELLSILIFAGAITLFWSCIDWRKTDHAWLKDVFGSFLRYSLAFILLSYGLAKLNPETSQFQVPSFDRLAVSLGDYSPMGLLWTFMGASQPYTIFAGAGEVVAALLLIFRRTAILGAFVAIGVMANVVMLNFCYDVPVKIFSSHLLIAGCLVLLPDMRWIANAFLFHRSADRNELTPAYANAKSIWYFRGLQALIIVLGIIYPTWDTVNGWIESRNPDCFGEYFVEEFRSPYVVAEGDETDSAAASGKRDAPLKKITLRRWPMPMDDEQEEGFTDMISVKSEDASESYEATVSFDPENLRLKVTDFQGRRQILPQDIQVSVIDDDHIELTGKLDEGEWYVKLARRKEDFQLMSRGFHWVSQRPYNR